jgi:LPS-assembly lipoprotein
MSARARLALPLALVLGACGFHPLYGGYDGKVGTTLASIYVEPIPDRLGYELRNTLIDMLDSSGHAGGAAYRLQINMTQKSEGIALQNDATITRYNDTLNATYELTDMKTGAVVTKGVESGLSAYNVVTSPYATFAARQDADTRSAEDIAERIRLDLALYFAHRK